MAKNLKEELQAARYSILNNRPYFAQALLAMDIIESPLVPTMGVDKFWRLYFNPEFTEKQSHKNLKALLLHEMLHLLRNHSGRGETFGITEETHKLWNVAADMEINDDLRDENWELPEGCLYPGTFECEDHKTAEEYYDKLYDKAEKIQQQMQQQGEGCGNGNCGSGADGQQREWESGSAKGDKDGEDDKDGEGNPRRVGEGIGEMQGELIRRQTAKEIINHQKSCGNMPGHLIRWADQTLGPPKIDWAKELRNIIKKSLNSIRYGREDYKYTRPSRRTIPRVILPSMVQYDVSMGIVIDTSGSIDGEELAIFLTEVKSILAQCGQSAVDVISCDAAVNSVVSVRNVMDLKDKIAGGGGTDLREAFKYVDEQRKQPDLLVIFTDGYTPWVDKEPKYGVISVITKHGTTSDIPKWMKYVKLED